MNILAHYVVNFDPFALRFPESWGVEGIRWYGLAYMAGFIIALLLMALYSKKNKSSLSNDDNSTLITYLLFGVIIGGRLGYMLGYDLQSFLENPLLALQIWKGGMASHGGFIGVIIAMALFAKFNKKSFLKTSDVVVSVCTPGIFLGRIANFINGELWGKISDAPWAVIFPASAPHASDISQIAARHPSQLYEAFLEGLFLFIYTQFRFWKFNLPRGQLAGEFLVLYSALRIFCEIFREPDAGVELIMGLSRGTFYSIFCMLFGFGAIIFTKRLAKKNA